MTDTATAPPADLADLAPPAESVDEVVWRNLAEFLHHVLTRVGAHDESTVLRWKAAIDRGFTDPPPSVEEKHLSDLEARVAELEALLVAKSAPAAPAPTA